MKLDFAQQLADYRGVLSWSAFTDGQGVDRPKIDIPLYIRDHPMPIRRRKVTEVVTMNQSLNQFDIQVATAFEGSPEVLQLELGGWIVTPISNKRYVPKAADGTSLNLGNVCYADIITAFLEGRMNPGLNGYYQRKDPDYYISPYGSKYLNPQIAVWEPTHTIVQKKQPFNMLLYLEH